MTVVNSKETYYDVLHIQSTASQAEVKAAYHRVLLSAHPDKNVNSAQGPESFDIARLQDAYKTLFDAESRESYDASLLRLHKGSDSTSTRAGPRPAQVISLEEFSVQEGGDISIWTHGCRCGGTYEITESDLDSDRHLIACEQCSEVVYVGYEVLEDGEDDC